MSRIIDTTIALTTPNNLFAVWPAPNPSTMILLCFLLETIFFGFDDWLSWGLWLMKNWKWYLRAWWTISVGLIDWVMSWGLWLMMNREWYLTVWWTISFNESDSSCCNLQMIINWWYDLSRHCNRRRAELKWTEKRMNEWNIKWMWWDFKWS